METKKKSFEELPLINPVYSANKVDIKNKSDNIDELYLDSLAELAESQVKNNSVNDDIAKDFFIHGSNYVNVYCHGETFAIMKTSKEFIQRELNLNNDEMNNLANYLVRNKKLPPFKVNHISDINANGIHYTYNKELAEFTVFYPAIEQQIIDNSYIENYLADTFKEYKDFIKKYLAVFVHSNYKKLPTLCFTGGRGIGKNTFAEGFLGSIFPSLSIINPDFKTGFNSYIENKLIIIDESNEGARDQYLTLKKLSGQSKFRVNPKFEKEYSTRNNINVVILSNEPFFIYVSRDEMPTDETNNQFFIFEMKPPRKKDPMILDNLKARLGNYIRTELKDVFNSLDLTPYRYSIEVPITEEERFLFSNSVTENELVTDEIIKDIEKLFEDNDDVFYSVIRQGLLPTLKLREFYKTVKTEMQIKHASYNKILQMLKIKGIIQKKDAIRMRVNGEKIYLYEVGDKIKKLIDPDPIGY